MFPSSGSRRGNKKTKKNQFFKLKEVTCTFGIGHCELIIFPTDSNGDPFVFDSYYASHNECRTSQYALNSS